MASALLTNLKPYCVVQHMCILLYVITTIHEVVSLESNGLRSPAKLSECAAGDTVCQGDAEKDLQGLEAIRTIHRQIDDDHNGNVDLSESDEFLRDELQYKTDFERQHTLHGEDKLISVDDLWQGWKYSEVYNWTVDESVAWLCDFVGLPQYAESFKKNAIEGSAIPRLAINSAQFLTAILGITDPIHRQKISLKAMDVVLFGPAKQTHSYLKDMTLLVSLIIAVGGCWFAYVQHRYSQQHVRQMLRDMEGLQKAEDSLSEVQEKLGKAQEEHKTALREKQSIEAKLTDEISRAMKEAERLHEARIGESITGGTTSAELQKKLRLAEEELVQVRNALEEAERQMSSGSRWHPPPALQQWLQLTYEMEKKYYTFKRDAAHKQLKEAKDVVEKIRKKRGTFMGSFRIAHGSSLDDVDARIINARVSLSEVTTELKERLHRWSMVELLCDFHIVTNPGIHHLITTLGVIMPETPGSSIGAAMIIGSTAHVESNASMGMDECDEDIPPPPTYNLTTSSLQAASTQHLDQNSLKKSRSTSSMQQQYGSTQSLEPTSSAKTAANPSPRNSIHLGHDSSPNSSLEQTEAAHQTSSNVNRPHTLPLSRSDNALTTMVNRENGKKSTDSYKSKKESKKDGDADSLEMDEEKKKKKRIRIPGLTSSKVDKLKTC